MQKYKPLAEHLAKQNENHCVMTFCAFEEVIGVPLPDSARKHNSWWGNDKTHVQASSWMQEGWLVQSVDQEKEEVRFIRTARRSSFLDDYQVNNAVAQVVVRNLDLAAVEALKKKAKRKGRSLEAELREIITNSAVTDRTNLIESANLFRSSCAKSEEDVVEILRKYRSRK